MQRVLYLLLALVFLAFAALNLNDPDPVIWVLAYGSVAILYAMAALGRADWRISGWREFLGLLIAVVALLGLTWRTPREARLG